MAKKEAPRVEAAEFMSAGDIQRTFRNTQGHPLGRAVFERMIRDNPALQPSGMIGGSRLWRKDMLPMWESILKSDCDRRNGVIGLADR